MKQHWFVLIVTLQNNSFSCDVGDWEHCVKYVTGEKSSFESMSDKSHNFVEAKHVLNAQMVPSLVVVQV